jgi:hypothetical protein
MEGLPWWACRGGGYAVERRLAGAWVAPARAPLASQVEGSQALLLELGRRQLP